MLTYNRTVATAEADATIDVEATETATMIVDTVAVAVATITHVPTDTAEMIDMETAEIVIVGAEVEAVATEAGTIVNREAHHRKHLTARLVTHLPHATTMIAVVATIRLEAKGRIT